MTDNARLKHVWVAAVPRASVYTEPSTYRPQERSISTGPHVVAYHGPARHATPGGDRRNPDAGA